MSEQIASSLVVSPDEREAIIEAISDTWWSDESSGLPDPALRRDVFERVFSGGDRAPRDESVVLSDTQTAVARAVLEHWLVAPYDKKLQDPRDEYLRTVGRTLLLSA